MSKTIQFYNPVVGSKSKPLNAVLSGDTIRLDDGRVFTLQESDAIRLLCWCEDLIKHAETRRKQRQQAYTECCDDIRFGAISSATDPEPENY